MRKNDVLWGGMFLLKINLDNEYMWVHSVFQTFLHLKYFQSTQIKMAENNSIVLLHIHLTLFCVCRNAVFAIFCSLSIHNSTMFFICFGFWQMPCQTTFRPWRNSVLQRMLILPWKNSGAWPCHTEMEPVTGCNFSGLLILFFFSQIKIS